VAPEDLAPGAQTLPLGRLREAADALAAADAILTADSAVQMPQEDERPLFRMARRLGDVRTGHDEGLVPHRQTPVLVVSGIANPARFVRDVTDAGWQIADAIAFRDHHSYTQADVARFARLVKRRANGEIRFLLLTGSSPERLVGPLEQAGLTKDEIVVRKVKPADMYAYLSAGDLGVSFGIDVERD